jgi:hypothetical protein
MRTLLNAALAAALLAPVPWAVAGTAPAPEAAPGEQVLLLVPAEAMIDFEASLSPGLAADVGLSAPAERLWLEGREYQVVPFRAERFEDLYRDVGQQPFHDDLKVAVEAGEFVHVTDLTALEFALGIGPSAPGDAV